MTYLELVRALAQYVVVLDAGRVVSSTLPALPDLPPRQGTRPRGEPLLQAMNVSASLRPRGRHLILHDVDLGVRPGECVGRVGHEPPPPVLTSSSDSRSNLQ